MENPLSNSGVGCLFGCTCGATPYRMGRLTRPKHAILNTSEGLRRQTFIQRG